MNKIDIIAGARPNFMKIGPIIHAITRHNNDNPPQRIRFRLIHTGQHYDKKMSEDFFVQLNIPAPDLNLGVGSGSQAYQTAHIMMKYEKALNDWKPELCLVVGDVTSTMACAITAKKEGVRVAHVEGGIRSNDLSMPEEINRMVTDSISDYFFTTSENANEILLSLGHKPDAIHFVGNTMIDSLLSNMDRLKQPEFFQTENLQNRPYFVTTLHRPSNVDKAEDLRRILHVLNENVGDFNVVFPMHPRTQNVFKTIKETFKNIMVVDPLPYLEFIYLVNKSRGVITDSGGITEETTVLKVPCLTLRSSTERPETITEGSNELVGVNPIDLIPFINKIKTNSWKESSIPKYWDGKTSDRIVNIISSL